MEQNRDTRLTPRAREMRNNSTVQENQLWHGFLKQYPVRFFRQFIIGEYIADFCCRKAKLVVELDGSHHLSDHQREYDRIRDHYLQTRGYTVVRFSNKEIDMNFSQVCTEINRLVRERYLG
ncbi:MAG: endonuclease domain-containing protein [Oscillospiraceae bacterium]|nr:endonuclease domain-containing protein [Oscillospiraceae bacterium]